MKHLFRALAVFRADTIRILGVVFLMLTSVGLNVLKPWPLALIVDCILGGKSLPTWWPETFLHWAPAFQLTALIGLMISIHLSHAVLAAAQNYLAINVGLRGLKRVRNEVFNWLQRLSLRFHHGTAAGDLIFRAGTDTCAFPTLLQQGLLIFVSATVSLGFMAVVMFRLNWPLTIVALSAAPVLLITIRLFGSEMSSRGLVAQRAESRVYALIHQGIAALPLTLSYTRERYEERRFAKETHRAQQHKMSQHGLEVLYWFAIAVVLILNTALVTWLGARQVMASQLTLGELLVFLAYLTQMFEPLNQLSLVGATISGASASVRRVFEILDTPEGVKELPNALTLETAFQRPPVDATASANPQSGAGLARSNAPILAQGDITYDSVSFGYDESRSVLNRLSFEITAGESIAIIGPSGAGKTTLLNLLPRFFDPSEGAVLIDGIDLRQLRLRDLRSQIALVLQEPIILPTTVAENISYGNPGANLSEIEHAARQANAHDFVSRLPLGYRTVIGEGGTRLSVGERQRINLARAFLKNAPILVMDEPTSALDVESETQVVESLAELMRGRTTLMVAHRLSTIQRVSKILVLDGGRIREFGTPRELMAGDGYYSRVISGQIRLNPSPVLAAQP